MSTSFFTFGQSHVHRVFNHTFDCDVVVEITSDSPRASMVSLFGRKWAMEYEHEPDMRWYPRGIIKLHFDEHGHLDTLPIPIGREESA